MSTQNQPPEIKRQWTADAVRTVIRVDIEVKRRMLRAIKRRGATEAIREAAEADLEAGGEDPEPTNLAETVFEYRYCQCEDPEPRDAVPPKSPNYPLKECGRCGGEL
ncbi:MAG: hypothetical protein ABEJ94_06820 [Halorientalis sp.]